MYEDDEEDGPAGALSAPAAEDGPTRAAPGGGALTAMSAPEGLFQQPELIPMPVDPVNKSTKWRQFAGSVLKGHTLAEGLGNATSAYADQENKDAEMRMRYIPLANQARLQRAQQQLNAQKQQQAMMEQWNKTLVGNAASALDQPGPVDPAMVQQIVASSVQRGQVPQQLAAKFISDLPKDPVVLRSYLERAAISMVDPFRAVAAPKFQNVAEGATLVQTNAAGGPKPVAVGGAKPSELLKAITEATKLAPNDPRRRDYENLITKLTTHNPNSTTIINPAKPLINELMGGLGTQIIASRGNAEASVSTLNTVARLKDAIVSGRVRAGPGATASIWLAQLGQVMGVPGKSRDEMLTNTRNAIQTMANLELDAAQAMKGQGAITDAERGIIRRAAAGEIHDMTIPELRVLTNVLDRTAKYKISRYRASLSRLKMVPGGDAVTEILDIEVPDFGQRKVLRFDKDGKPVEE